jgi:signal transduction histidine kinase
MTALGASPESSARDTISSEWTPRNHHNPCKAVAHSSQGQLFLYLLPYITRKGEAFAQQICNHFQMPLEFSQFAYLQNLFVVTGFGGGVLCEDQRFAYNVATETGLSLEAAFYRATWFYILAALLLVVMIWIAHNLRLRVLTDRLRNLLSERLSERERITRELYDTLLQGMQGLILLFQGIAVQIPPETPLASRAETAISRAERLMVEGRDSVRELRTPNFNLPDALRGLNAEQRPSGTEYSVEVNGRERKLQLLVSDEVFKIAREAIVQAFQHASAYHVWVTLTYRRHELDLIIVDDGRDVSNDVSENGTTGRWGLSGMKGRARKLQSRLLISNRSPTGTEVRLTVPAGVAYDATMFFVAGWLRKAVNFLRRRGAER